jgi:Ca-activated chloride channel family protein
LVHFEHKEYLLALAGVLFLIVLFRLLLIWKRKAIQRTGDQQLVAEITQSFSPQKFLLKFILSAAAFSLLVLALSNLRKPGGSQAIKRNGIDIIIALDVSKSMLAEDIKPNRLERAKQLLSKLADRLGDNRIGLVVFAGKAYLQMPVSADHSAAKLFISSITTDIAPTPGTVIGDALMLCDESFNNQEKKYKSVLLISDGEDHDPAAADAASQLKNDGIIINAVGIGSPEGSPIINPLTGEYKKDNEGATVITKLNEHELEEISGITHGVYTRFTNSEEVISIIMKQLDGMEQRTITDNSLVNYESQFQWFLAAALVLLLIEFFISEKRTISKGRMIKRSVSMLCLALPVSLLGQTDNKFIKQGNEAYLKKEYGNAALQYQQASELNPVAQYNLGNAQYKDQKTAESILALDNAIKNAVTREQRAMAYYNKGVVLQHSDKLAECIDAYKNALRISPEDEDARQNLQIALKKFRQENPKKNKENKKPEKPKENNQQHKPQPSKLSRADAEEKLKTLSEREKTLQEKLNNKNKPGAGKPEKDW